MGDTAEDLACKIVFDICRCDSADHLIDFAQEAIEARDAAIRAEAKREELQRIAKMVREREAEQDRLGHLHTADPGLLHRGRAGGERASGEVDRRFAARNRSKSR